MGLLGDARFPRRKKADRAGHRHKRRDPEISLWDPSRPAAALCLSPPPRVVQYRLNCWWRGQVPSMGWRGGWEGPLRRGWLCGVECKKRANMPIWVPDRDLGSRRKLERKQAKIGQIAFAKLGMMWELWESVRKRKLLAPLKGL